MVVEIEYYKGDVFEPSDKRFHALGYMEFTTE